jgi:hypothetical protein
VWQTASVNPAAEPGAESPVVRGPHIWTRRGERDGPVGPPPPLLGLTVSVYALCGVALAGVGIVAVVQGQGWGPLGFFLPIAIYCGALAWTASRIRSRSPEHRASAWLLAPVLFHAVLGLAGTSAIVREAFGRPMSGSPLTVPALATAGVGVLFGWVLALFPLQYGRRAGWFTLAALSGPVLLFVMSSLAARMQD